MSSPHPSRRYPTHQEELASILKFGAQDLFTETPADEQLLARQMYEEDIDAVLERAEVVETRAEGNREASALLSSFNVATFKNTEDDETFWSKLIKEEDRPRKGTEPAQEPGIRAARLK